MIDNRNYIIAIAMSFVVLVFWHFMFNAPRIEEQRQEQLRQQEIAAQQPVPETGVGVPQPDAAAPPGQIPGQAPVPGGAVIDRAAALAASPRVIIETPEISGSLSLQGGRIDDVVLRQYRETVAPDSDNIVLLSPSGAPDPFYAEFGFVGAQGNELALPNADTLWTLVSGQTLTPGSPIVLEHTAGELTFRRTVSIDEEFLFTIEDSIANGSGEAVTLYPYGLVSRHGIPQIINFFILHEGLIGVLGEDHGLQEVDYDDLIEQPAMSFDTTGGWLGITDKYWATTLIPDQQRSNKARFASGSIGPVNTFQADYLGEGITVPAGGQAAITNRLFAGAKEVSVIDSYETALGIDRFELLIDWGWFYFITKPLFFLIDYCFRLLGNFGVAILVVTVLIKLAFFPLANRSYKSMAGMKKVQPEMMKIRDRYKDDKVKQQQAMMELYKREKINPLSGCLPILLQIPVFFALYKVLFVTIEMRHAPFIGWIKDLSAPDPTSLFNLFGLIPWDPPSFLLIGVWPLAMGISMFMQMRLNPPPPDPTQAMIFNWMPLLFTFLLASFPAGLVIYWTWNNLLSMAQQYYIMRRQGVDVDLWGNTIAVFKGGSKPDEKT